MSPFTFIGGYVNFKPACDTHDRCYNECNKPRKKCDEDFKTNLYIACSHKWSININMIPTTPLPLHKINDINPFYKACLGFAEAYHNAVRLAGEGPYKQGQNESCYCAPCPCS